MSVERAIHERWEGCRPLCDLVPAARLVTGLAQAPLARPYVTLARVEESTTARTTHGAIESLRLRFSIHDESLDRAKRVADEVMRLFNRADFDWSQGRILDCKPLAQTERQADDGEWTVALDFLVRAARAAVD